MNKTIYVLGFMFSASKHNVVLIEKQKPDWQRGKLNGIGGKMKPSDGGTLNAMCREFGEETGVKTLHKDWREFCVMFGADREVVCFVGENDDHFAKAKTVEEEEVVQLFADDLRPWPVVSNLTWLIALAKDDNYGRPHHTTVNYNLTA